VVHYSLHAGQIVFLSKPLEGGLEEPEHPEEEVDGAQRGAEKGEDGEKLNVQVLNPNPQL